MIRAILFDIHETLITKDPAGVNFAQDRVVAYLTKSGCQIERFRYVNGWVKALRTIAADPELNETDLYSLWRSIMAEAGLHDVDDRLINRLNDEWVAAFRDLTTPLPHAASVLDRLRREYLTAAVSNSFTSNTMIDLEVTGLTGFFQYIVTSSDVGKRKPHPRPFLRATEFLEVTPNECVFVGNDVIEDIYGAKKVGMKAILLQNLSSVTRASKFGRERMADPLAVPDCVVDSLADLCDAIAGILATGM